MLDVPSNSYIEKRIQGEHGIFSAVTNYLKMHPDQIEKVYETLSYFDTMNMADKIQCKILASVGLKDNVCPAECYFATYNRITSPKVIKIYPFSGHEGGLSFHHEIKHCFLRENLT
jgi:cephalosporin-C deacetylase